MKSICKFLFPALIAAIGCRSPQVWREQADRAADRNIAEFQEKALGRQSDFSIERPSDTLRRRLMIEQDLPVYTNRTATARSPKEPIILDKIACLQVAARNNRGYQDQKEDVFRSALALDLERDAYRNSWSGLLSALFSSDQTGDESENRLAGNFTAQLSRKMKSGASIAGRLGLDVIKLLTLDRSSSYGLLADATITIPLLRGSGTAIVTEPLTQAERDLMYALWRFDRYRKTFAVQVASEYFSVLQSDDELRNAIESVERLQISLERSQELAQAGRMPELEVDQTRQDLLRTRSRVIAARQNSESRLDSFKQTLGLPVDARLALDKSELEELSEWGSQIEPAADLLDESKMITTALTERSDLRITYEQTIDSARKLAVARDALRMGLEFEASATNQERRYAGTDTPDVRFQDGSYTAGLDLDLPWEKTAERNQYRLQLIGVEQARRQLEEQEDQVKLEIRNSIRALDQARQNYIIQREALNLADVRIESTQLFLEAGRASTRDLLEAENALLSAKNAVTAAMVSYRVSQLELLNNLGTLEIEEEWGIQL